MNLSARDNFISFLQTNSICCSDLICSDEWEPMILLGLSRSHNGRNSYQIFKFELVAKMAANEQKLSFYFIDTTTCCFDKELMNNYYIITPQIRHDKKVAHYKKNSLIGILIKCSVICRCFFIILFDEQTAKNNFDCIYVNTNTFFCNKIVVHLFWRFLRNKKEDLFGLMDNEFRFLFIRNDFNQVVEGRGKRKKNEITCYCFFATRIVLGELRTTCYRSHS